MKRSSAKMRKALMVAAGLLLGASSRVQSITYVVDQFNPSGTGGYSYSGGQINNVWANWFGGAYQSATWDSTSDASNNANSGSLKIVSSFNSTNNQYEVYDGLNGISPALNGLLYTNFQCDVRFDAGSAVTTNGGTAVFGHLQFGVATPSFGQDYFGSIDVPASNTNWVHVSVPVDAAADTNLLTISDVLIHIYGPYYSPALNGASTLWIDNIQFTGPAPATNDSCLVDAGKVYQHIDGFGASSAWDGSWNSTQADMFFATNVIGSGKSNDGRTNFTFTSIGLSLLRNHIAYAGTTSATAIPGTVETSIMQMAQARGARVWSTPWTPPAGFKSTNDIYDTMTATGGGINGGSYLGSGNNATNLAYAGQLANYVAGMKNTYGVNLYAISIQNEPDAQVNTYEACQWTGQQFHDFVTNLYAALAAKGVGSTKIILPESQNWEINTGLYTPVLSDPVTASETGIIADHDYVANNNAGDLSTPAQVATQGQALWETEVSQFGPYDGSITNALYWAGRIHLFMTAAQANAWHFWWIVPDGSDNEGLVDTNGIPSKRMYAIGQFSRFVRPGYYRINATNTATPEISAYRDSASPGFAVVAINNNPFAMNESFTLTNFSGVKSVTPWITSGNDSLASQAVVGVTNFSFSYTLPPMSVVTFAGQAVTDSPPVLAAVANRTINPGVTLVITNTATDTNNPQPILNFSLLSAPTNAGLAAVNGTNGVFTWRPTVSQAGTTNAVRVRVADNNTPSLSATNNFTVTVNPVSQPVLGPAGITNGTVMLKVTGIQGPDYTLLSSSNLFAWQAIYTTNSPLLPMTLTDTNAGATARFYRIQLGP